LTALQERKVSRIGEAIERPFNARLLFATNAPLNEWVAEGRFRQDLMFRINTVEVEIPPLRERKDDIKEFVSYFMKIYNKKYKKESLKISDAALELLNQHDWPGNVRELQHTIERGVIMSESDEIRSSDFNLTINAESGLTTDESHDNLNLQEIEKLLVEKALEKHDGNISKAAKELGLTRAALYRRLKKFDI